MKKEEEEIKTHKYNYSLYIPPLYYIYILNKFFFFYVFLKMHDNYIYNITFEYN